MTESKSQTVQHCTCGTHCKTSCPFFAPLNQDGCKLRAFCGQYDTWLLEDPHYLRYAKLLFCRTRQCKVDHIDHAERRECRPVN